MSFTASSGRILVKDGSHVVMDTDEELFHGTDFVTGSITIPQRVAIDHSDGSQTNINSLFTHSLGSVNSNANTVMGAFQITTATGQGVANLGWFSVGGTYVHYYSGLSFFNQPLGTNNRMGSAQTFTFRATSGGLFLDERIVLQASGSPQGTTNTLTVFAITIQYKLYAGLFT